MKFSAPCTRVKAPAAFNHTTDSFKRRMTSQARDADPWHKPEKKRGGWRYLVALVLLALAAAVGLTGCSEVEAEDSATESKAAVQLARAATKACEGATAVWIDSTTMECVKETK